MTVNLTSAAAGAYNLALAAGSVTTTNAGANPIAASAVLTVLRAPTAQLQIAPASIAPGATAIATLTLANANTVDLTGVGSIFTLPANVTLASTVAWTCGGSLSGLTLSGATLAANTSCTVTFSITSATVGTHALTIAAGAVTTANAGSNDVAASSTLTVGGFAPPIVTAAFTPERVARGAMSTLTITIENSNLSPLSGVAFRNALPAGLIVGQNLSPSNGCGGTLLADAGASLFSLAGGAVPASTRCAVSVAVVAAQPGTHTNVIAAGAVTTTQSVANAVAAVAPLTVSSPLAASVSFTPASIISGGSSTLAIELTNSNPVALTGLTMQSRLPAQLRAVAGAAVVNTCGGQLTLTSGTLQLTNGGLAASAGRCTVQVMVTSDAAGSWTHVVGASDVQTANGVSNDEAASATLTVIRSTITIAPTVVVNESAGHAVVRVSIANAGMLASSVRYSTRPVEAQFTTDYLAVEGVLRFEAGTKEQLIRIPLVDDSAPERVETFLVTLSRAENAAIAHSSAIVYIEDDDPPIMLMVADVARPEGSNGSATRFEVVIMLSAPVSEPVIVDYATPEGTANADSDFTMTSGTVLFAPGEVSKTIVIDVVADSDKESDESFGITVSSIWPPSRATATITIQNDDGGRRRSSNR